jgi:hypothetical protein
MAFLSAAAAMGWRKPTVGSTTWRRTMRPSATNSYPSYTPAYNAVSGPGYLLPVGTASSCTYGTNAYEVWLTNAVAQLTNNGRMNLQFTIEGGASAVAYDVFANSTLGLIVTNSSPWAWMGQGYTCQTYTLTNLQGACYLVLGTPVDTSGSGLTDAYERLVLHLNPQNQSQQTDAYGVPIGWYAQHGLDPVTPGIGGQDPDQDGLLNYQEYLYGTNPQVSEGFGLWVGTPSGASGIP